MFLKSSHYNCKNIHPEFSFNGQLEVYGGRVMYCMLMFLSLALSLYFYVFTKARSKFFLILVTILDTLQPSRWR